VLLSQILDEQKSANEIIINLYHYTSTISTMTVVEFKNEKCGFKQLENLVDQSGVTALRLEGVNIEGDFDDMYEFSKAVRGHYTLEELSLVNVTVNDKEVDLDQVITVALVSCDKLSTLRAENTPFTTSALAAVGYCKTLKKLQLASNKLSDMDVVSLTDSVAGSHSIEVLDLSNNDLSDIGCESLERCLKANASIRELKLAGNSNISGEEFTKISAQLKSRSAMAA